MERTEIISILKQLGFSPNKNLGQNFLLSNIYPKRIASLVDMRLPYLEIGPGLGSLTRFLQSVNYTGIEIDKGYYQYLKNVYPNLSFIHQDCLKEDFSRYDTVIGNIPYCITKEILSKIILEQVNHAVLMVQKEVFDKLMSIKRKTAFIALIQLTYDLKNEMVITKDNFYPVPNIDSLVFRMDKKEVDFDIKTMKRFLDLLYLHKRKKIGYSFKGDLDGFKDKRVEELGLDDLKVLYELSIKTDFQN